MRVLFARLLLCAGVLAAGEAAAQDIKIALLAGRTGPLEAYAKQTEAGLMLGLEYLTNGTMTVNGRKIVILSKDDQGKPDLAKSLLEKSPDPSETEVRYWLAGNLCRCTGYDKIVRAVMDAAAEMRGA